MARQPANKVGKPPKDSFCGVTKTIGKQFMRGGT